MTQIPLQRPGQTTRLIPHLSAHQRESLDSIGLGRLVEGQIGGVMKIIRDRGLFKELPPTTSEGRGIVISAGGRYLDYGWVNARWIRHLGIQLPIQIWYLGEKEMPARARPHFAKLDVELVDSFGVRRSYWHHKLEGWQNKLYSVTRCPFREVVFYDADSFAASHPDRVFASEQFQSTGAVFWKDVNRCRPHDWLWTYAGITSPETEMDSGTFFIDRVKAWRGLQMANWLNEHSNVTYHMAYGDKDMADVGFRFMGVPFHLADSTWDGHGIGHWLNGEHISRHQMAAKRQEHAFHDPILGRFFEEWRSLK